MNDSGNLPRRRLTSDEDASLSKVQKHLRILDNHIDDCRSRDLTFAEIEGALSLVAFIEDLETASRIQGRLCRTTIQSQKG